jgi:hypothetical protein
MMIDSVSVGFVIDPIAIVNISINMDELSFSMGSIVLPLPLVLRTIWPLLNSVPISKSTNPLSLVSGISLEGIGRPLLSLGIWVVCSVLRDGFSAFVNGKVP